MSKKINTSGQLLNVSEAAQFLGVNPGTIRRWAQTSTLQGMKVGIRGDWRFEKDELLKIARTNTQDESTESQLVEFKHVNINIDGKLVYEKNNFGSNDHFVQFYENDMVLADWVSEFIGTGLANGDACVVIATPGHREQIDKRLMGYGLNVESAGQRQQYIALDARETLDKFMIQGLPDKELFDRVIGGLVGKMLANRINVRAFGEMVALLWADGNKAGVIQLEKLWNELGKKYSFALFCAYPMKGVGGEVNSGHFNEVCTTHSKVLPSESYSSLTNDDQKMREIALLQQKARSLSLEIEERRKLEKQKDEFLAILSHELKTPVTSTKAYAQILHGRFNKSGDVRSADLLLKMDTQMNKLTGLIEDLLDITKIEVGKLKYNNENFDLNNMIEEIGASMKLLTDKHVISYDFSDSVNIDGDRDRLGQVLTNLVGNAIKYSPNGKRIIISTHKNHEEVVIGVRDFGIGIDKKDYKKVFDKFYRVGGKNRETYSGMGIGLFLSNEIIKRHGGRMRVESNSENNKKEQGTTFYFTLPLGK